MSERQIIPYDPNTIVVEFSVIDAIEITGELDAVEVVYGKLSQSSRRLLNILNEHIKECAERE